MREIHGDQINLARVRFVDKAPARGVTFRRQPRPRVTCRENILPPPTTDIVTAKPAAVALFNAILYDKDWYLDDYLRDFPDRVNLLAAMLFAHEMTHIWQWQNRKLTGYHPFKAALEHSAEDPYLFDLEAKPQFLQFGFEQQASIVEEYVCCRSIAPAAPRTARLHDLIAQVMPVSPLPAARAYDVILPWAEADLQGICD